MRQNPNGLPADLVDRIVSDLEGVGLHASAPLNRELRRARRTRDAS